MILSGDQFLTELLGLIDSSVSSVDIEVYIFEPGVIASRLFQSLHQAADRGVRVRLLVDGAGGHNFIEDFEEELEAGKIEFKIFHPVPWHFSNYRVSLAWWPSTMFQLFGSINNRNHRKVAIADGDRAIVGSFNIADEHLPKTMGGQQWLDVAVLVEGECVGFLVSAYEHAWEGWLGYHGSLSRWFGIRTFLQFQKSERYFLMNHTARLRKSAKDRLARHLRTAQERIWICTPYFAPTWRFISLLGSAAKRGVDVRLMIPARNDVVFMAWVMKTYYATLLKRKIRIFEYTPSVLHAKIAIVDSWISVGSTNLNSRSLFHDLEANYLLQMDATERQLVQFVSDTCDHSCREVLESDPTSWVDVLLGRIALIFKYWI